MKRTLVISDIHGELELFNKLLNKINYDAKQDQLILLGDYIDRGPDSKGVVNRVIELKAEGAVVLKGNHDDMMASAADNQTEIWKRWERAGALTTLQSYDSSINSMVLPDDNIYKNHTSFLKELDYYYELENYIFVHAGIQPEKPLLDNNQSTFLWIREQFYEAYTGDKTIVFGHTPVSILRNNRNHNIYFGDNNIIGIDGAAAYGGQLNCLELPSMKTYNIKNNKLLNLIENKQ